MLAKFGFADDDRRSELHDHACRFLVQPDVALRLAIAMFPDVRADVERDLGQWCVHCSSYFDLLCATSRFKGFRLIATHNELPKFPDSSGAITTRPLLFRFTESFVGKEDLTLEAKLQAELPGILLWAIEGWKRLRKQGRFQQPLTGQELIDQMRDLSSPVGAFVRERCDVGAGYLIPRGDLFFAWTDWCKLRYREPGTADTFGKHLRAACPHLGMTQPTDADGNRFRAYEGIKLKSVC
jgi:hypothetical protein